MIVTLARIKKYERYQEDDNVMPSMKDASSDKAEALLKIITIIITLIVMMNDRHRRRHRHHCSSRHCRISRLMAAARWPAEEQTIQSYPAITRFST